VRYAAGVLLVVVLLVGCAAQGQAPGAVDDPIGGSDSAGSEEAGPGTSAAQDDPVSTSEGQRGSHLPLTGVAGTPPDRPALVVKIDNFDAARPQFGLEYADIVFEEVVEGGLTRFAAVFHSRDADPVGPVRSARTSDFGLLEALSTPLFANSGANDGVLALLSEVDMIDVSSNAARDAYYRLGERDAPHNLLSSTPALFAAGVARGGQGIPTSLFAYREPGAPLHPDAVTVQGLDLEFGSNAVSYRWDGDRAGWVRTQNGSAHLTAAGALIAPPNLVVQFISYGRSAADGRSPEAELVGSGELWVFSEGTLVRGSWRRADLENPTEWLDVDGMPLSVGVGATWVALPRVGQAVVVE